MMSVGVAKLLARAAALQGRAIPVSRFEFQSGTDAGLPFSELATETVISESWLAVFAQGETLVQNALPSKDQCPAVWLSKDRDPVLIRGITSQRVFVEDTEGSTRELDFQELGTGRSVLLRVPGAGDASLKDPARTPTSATGWFIHSIFKRRRVFWEGALATLLVGLFGLAASLYTMQVYDRVIPLKGYSTLIMLTLGVAIAITMELVMKQVRAIMVERACKAIDQELSDVFFSKAIAIRLDARPRTVGTFASQIRHFESVRNFMTSTTLMVLADIPLALMFIGVIGMIAGWIALVPLRRFP